MMQQIITGFDDENFEEHDMVEEETASTEALPFVYSISSYGTDFDVAGLVRRYNAGDLYVPEFQRDYVWDNPRASQFIRIASVGTSRSGDFSG